MVWPSLVVFGATVALTMAGKRSEEAAAIRAVRVPMCEVRAPPPLALRRQRLHRVLPSGESCLQRSPADAPAFAVCLLALADNVGHRTPLTPRTISPPHADGTRHGPDTGTSTSTRDRSTRRRPRCTQAIVREMHIEIHKHSLRKHGEDDVWETVPAICLAIVQNYTLHASPPPERVWRLAKRTVRLDDEEGGGEAADFEHILLLKRACEVPLH